MNYSIFNSLFPYALVLAALTYLTKSLIEHWLDKDVDKFKSRIEKEANLEIEKYKNQLDVERLRLQISYGGIFEKQATAILELHQHLLDLETAASDALHNAGTNRDRSIAFGKVWKEALKAYHENRILIPQEIDTNLEQFLNTSYQSVFTYLGKDEARIERMTDEQFEQFSIEQDSAINLLQEKLPSIKLQLIYAMRNTIGTSANINKFSIT